MNGGGTTHVLALTEESELIDSNALSVSTQAPVANERSRASANSARSDFPQMQ